MIISTIINFSILFTFIVLIYFLYEFFGGKHLLSLVYYRVLVGILGGMVIILLMMTAMHVSSNVIADNRPAVMLLINIIGGPISCYITTLIACLYRMFFLGFTMTSFIAAMNTLAIGFLMATISIKVPITIKNVHLYLFGYLLEYACFVFLITNVDPKNSGTWLFLLTTVVAFYATYAVLYVFKKQFAYTRKMELIADTDFLTGIPNNRIFQERLDEAVQIGQPFALMTIDIDHFKLFNRQFTHLIGDEVLQQLARLLQRYATKHNSYICRKGGEEFYLLCYDAHPATAISYAAEIRSILQHQKFILSNGESVQITLSFGIANYPDNGKTASELMNCADILLRERVDMAKPAVIIHANQQPNT